MREGKDKDKDRERGGGDRDKEKSRVQKELKNTQVLIIRKSHLYFIYFLNHDLEHSRITTIIMDQIPNKVHVHALFWKAASHSFIKM